jgi:hypothetical protein
MMTNPPADAMREALELLKEIEFFAANNAKSAHLIMDKEVWRAHARKVREVVAALSAARTDRDGWQPIESAPKDGRRQLIAWLSISNEWQFSFARWDDQVKHYCLEHQDICVGARYWQPLPSAPAPPEGQGK